MHPTLVDELLQLATQAATAGGEAARASISAHGLEVDTKSAGLDVVTNADRASQQAIFACITAARPDDGLIGEEGGDRTGTTGVDWVVDPIDSTANLVHSLPIWSVSVAARVDGAGVAGAVFSPAIGEMFTGGTGRGVLVNGRRTSPPAEANGLPTTLGLIGWPAGHRDPRRDGVIADLIAGAGRLRSPGSPALGLAWTAAGRADFAYYEQGFYDWDVAAGLVMCEEAGLTIRLERGTDGPHRLLVARPALFDELDRIVFR